MERDITQKITWLDKLRKESKTQTKNITQGQEGNMYIYKIKYLHFYKGSMLSIDLN